MSSANNSSAKAPVQRIGVFVGLVAAFYIMGSVLNPGSAGTFSATSKSRPHSGYYDDGENAEADDWGNGTRGTSSRRAAAEARAQAIAEREREGSDRRDIPVYDPGKDGGWGSN